MSITTRKRKKKDTATHLLTKELIVSVCKMKVTELSKWTPVLQAEQTPALCFEGYVSKVYGQKRRYTAYRTQPVDVRLGSYLFRQVNGETCSLVGDLYDPSNNLPFSVKSKFKNGIPTKWQTVAKFWYNMQKHSFCRKQLRSSTSKIRWVESLKSSGLIRVSSRGRIIIPSPKYLKAKNVEQREIEKAHLINSQLKLIRTNLDLAPVHDIDDVRGTPRPPVENICNTVNGNKPHHHTNCDKSTECSVGKSNFSHKTCENSQYHNMQTRQNFGDHIKDTRRSSINQRKPLTCKRKLVVAEVQNEMHTSSKTSKNTYEKITNKYHYRCLPHRRKYLLRSTSAVRLLQKNNLCKSPKVTLIDLTDDDRISIPQRKQPLQIKRKLNIVNNKNSILQCQIKKDTLNRSKQTQEEKDCREDVSYNEHAVQNSVLEPKPCSDDCRNKITVNVANNKGSEALLKFPFKKPCPIVRDFQSDNVLRNCANRFRKSKQRVCCQDGSDKQRPKRKSENFPPPKVNRKGGKTLEDTFEGSGTGNPAFTDRNSTAYLEPVPPKRHEEEINVESIPGDGQDLLGKKVALREISEDITRRDRFNGKCVSPECISSKCSESRLGSNERQRENRRSALRSQLNEKGLVKTPDRSRHEAERNIESIADEGSNLLGKKMGSRKLSRRDRFNGKCVSPVYINNKCSQPQLGLNDRQRQNRKCTVRSQPNEKTLANEPDRLRKKCLTSNKSSPAVTPAIESKTEALKDTKEDATTLEETLNSISKKKICKNDSKQPCISDGQSPEKTEPSVPPKDTLQTLPRNFEKAEPRLSLNDIEDILTTGAPRTLKQRKKLRKTIDSYAKSQSACTDLFSDPDYNHLIGANDPCSSQEWDRDYAEAIEKLVSGKHCDQISLGSTSPAQYIQDFVCDDNQSVRSTSPFERTPCDEEFKLRYEHRVLKERNDHTRRKSLNMDFLSSFAHQDTNASTEADAAYTALIQGKPVPQKLFDLKCKKKDSSDDSSSECSDEI